MTCVEKLKELHPEYSDEDINDIVKRACPSCYMEIASPPYCPGSKCTNEDSKRCWAKEFMEPVPWNFEVLWRDTVEHNGEVIEACYTKMHLTVLERVKHRYTGEWVYKSRVQGEEGWIFERFYTEKEVRRMLKARID